MFGELKLKAKKYDIGKLYIGYIAPLSTNDYQTYKCDRSERKVIIFTMTKDYDTYYDVEGKDVITNVKYYFLHRYLLLSNLIGSVVIYKFFPLANFLIDTITIKGKISKASILEIVNFYNRPKEKETESEIKDPVLNLILQTHQKIRKVTLKKEDKEYLYEVLKKIGEFYVNELIEIKTKDHDSSLVLKDPETELELKIIDYLNRVENEVNKAVISGNLNKDYQNFSRILLKK